MTKFIKIWWFFPAYHIVDVDIEAINNRWEQDEERSILKIELIAFNNRKQGVLWCGNIMR